MKVYTIGAELANGAPALVYNVNVAIDDGPATLIAKYLTEAEAETAINLLVEAESKYPKVYTDVQPEPVG